MELRRILPGWSCLAALLITLMAVAAGLSRGLRTSELLGAAPGVFLLLWGYFALSDARIQSLLTQWCRISGARTVALASCLMLPYLAYSLPLRCFSAKGFLALLLYVNLPVWALAARRKGGDSPVTDFAALLLIWLPLELGVLPPLWLWPPGQPGHFLDGLLGVVLAVYCFQVVRSLPGIGYCLIPRGRDWLLAGAGVLLFLPLALGLGAFTGFLRFSPHVPESPAILARILGIFLVTGVPEELLFRGLLQNLLLRWTGRDTLSLGLTAAVFGLAHLNVGAHPDWRLALLATLAGILYGWLFRVSGSLMAPSLAHTFVNSLWTFLFRG
ncbi:MAG: CPBP family intramembrane metalloprotease [Acidobacteria bacterium]|nr:CPBP family intramembrane metalloprotease [Acidobacteriota bacterium]